MARLPLVHPDQAPQKVAAALRELPPLNIIRTIAHADDVLLPWVGLSSSLLNDTVMSPTLREIAVLRVAAITPGADYEWDQHEVIAREVGLSQERIEAARSGSGLEGDDALVARFTEEFARLGSPGEETWASARERFSPREIVELMLVIGLYMMVGRVCATFHVDPDPPIGVDLFNQLKKAS